MLEDRLELLQKEIEYLNCERQKHPELFEAPSGIEDSELLERVGIRFPDKNQRYVYYLKALATDFIVEEISKDDDVYSIEFKELELFESEYQNCVDVIYLTLVKSNIQTLHALSDIAKSLDIDPVQIGYAGIKDKHGVTAQRISIRGSSFEDIKKIKSPFFFLKDATYGKGQINKGDLKGNRFSILLRPIEHDNLSAEYFQNIKQKFLEVENIGVYNFYYLQRFGVPRYNNFHRAYLILTGHYKEAVKLFFTEESDRDILYFTEIRKKLKAVFGDVEKMSQILKPFTVQFEYERLMLEYLKSYPDDYIGALKQIPDQITLWMYALSSWLHNKELSRLIENKESLPKTLPGFLSKNKDDYDVYKKMLVDNDMYPPPFNNLRPFPAIRLRSSETKTLTQVKIDNIKNIDQGIHITFILDKGQYATTFLSHVITLTSNREKETNLFEQVLLEDRYKEVYEYFTNNLYNKVI